jgi:hypothetical protein
MLHNWLTYLAAIRLDGLYTSHSLEKYPTRSNQKIKSVQCLADDKVELDVWSVKAPRLSFSVVVGYCTVMDLVRAFEYPNVPLAFTDV